jgi:selenocysteine lyase/cysteine desulfurase
MYYLDHAANSWPKPQVVYQALDSQPSFGPPDDPKTQAAIIAAQDELGSLFKLPAPNRLQFTQGCSQALSLAFQLIDWQPGDGVVISAVEHQSVVEPVLRLARERGVQFYIAPYSETMPFDLRVCEALLNTHPNIRLIATPHASNVIGCTLPVGDIGRLARRYNKLYLVDAAQTAGMLSLDVQRDGIDMLAMPGHKHLHGPRGIGALYVGEAVRPAFAPASLLPLAAQNSIGLPRLRALVEGTRWVREISLQTIRRHTTELLADLQDGLEEIPEVTLYGLSDLSRHIPVVSFNVLNHHPEALGNQLFEEFGLLLRPGLHRSRLSHEAIGTIHRGGALRVSLGYHTRPEDIDTLIHALKTILVGSLSGAWGLASRLNK